MWVVGERIVNLERMFNAREGFTREDDRMPERIVKEPLPYGPSAGQVLKRMRCWMITTLHVAGIKKRVYQRLTNSANLV